MSGCGSAKNDYDVRRIFVVGKEDLRKEGSKVHSPVYHLPVEAIENKNSHLNGLSPC